MTSSCFFFFFFQPRSQVLYLIKSHYLFYSGTVPSLRNVCFSYIELCEESGPVVLGNVPPSVCYIMDTFRLDLFWQEYKGRPVLVSHVEAPQSGGVTVLMFDHLVPSDSSPARAPPPFWVIL